MNNEKWIFGAGGGGDSQTRTQDSLLSQDYFEVVLALGQGPIKGLVSQNDPPTLENFFAGDTPAFNIGSNETNFSDFAATEYTGLPTDPPVDLKLGGLATNIPVGIQLASTVSVVRRTPSLQRNLFDRLEVRIRFEYAARTSEDGVFETEKMTSSSSWSCAYVSSATHSEL